VCDGAGGTSGPLECETVQNTETGDSAMVVEASCSTGYTLTGGGCQNLTINVAKKLTLDQAGNNTWQCSHGDTVDLDVTTTSICCKGGSGTVTTLPTCVDGEYLKKGATGWECTTIEEISSSIVTKISFSNIGCPENYITCDAATIQNNSNTKWGLAALINEAFFDYSFEGIDLAYCPWQSVSPGEDTIMNDFLTYQTCMGGFAMSPLCDAVCTDPEIMIDGSLSAELNNQVPGQIFETGFYVGGHPTEGNGVLICSCVGYS